MITRVSLIHSIHHYQTPYQEEIKLKDCFISLLAHPRAFFRDHLPGHITASSWIIDHAGEYALLTHHAKLNRWLQPGGHADGEEDVVSVAQREANEETGLTSLQLILPVIFDLDIHPIPARKDFPDHDHYDVRFLFKGNKNENLILSDESKDLKWVPIIEIAEKTQNNLSILRMAEKVKKLFSGNQN